MSFLFLTGKNLVVQPIITSQPRCVKLFVEPFFEAVGNLHPVGNGRIKIPLAVVSLIVVLNLSMPCRMWCSSSSMIWMA